MNILLRYQRTALRHKGSNMFFLDFLSWSYCYIFSIQYVFLIVIDFLRNETLFLNICFIPILPSLMKSLPNFEFVELFAVVMELPPPSTYLKYWRMYLLLLLIIFRKKTIVSYRVSLVHKWYLFTSCYKNKSLVNQWKDACIWTAFTCSKSTMEISKQLVKFVQSQK